MKQFESFVDVKSCSVSPLSGKKRLVFRFSHLQSGLTMNRCSLKDVVLKH